MDPIQIVLAGAAGEGIQTIGQVLAQTISAQGYGVFAWKEYESRIRGGHSSYSIRVTDSPRNEPALEADVLLALNKEAGSKYCSLLKEGGVFVSQEEGAGENMTVPFGQIAREEIGKGIYASTVALGALVSVLDMDLEVLKEILSTVFAGKGDDVVAANHLASEKGYVFAARECRDRCPWHLPRRQGHAFYLLTGNEAIPLGAAFAGCRFISAYPMTPSTGVITFMADNADKLGVFAEQAEDEIAAVNMAIGASYGGARAMTATSGGGFALMTEGISLAGISETPLVVVLAQRPGPGTGLATRTAQEDLLFAVHSGHGEPPKMVMAPADAADAFHKTVRAFNLADKYQIPVILVTDHFLAESHFSVEEILGDDAGPVSFLADPTHIEEYRRYRYTDDGVSPRLYPGRSRHLVVGDSHVHDELGHPTEDLVHTAVRMAEKRQAKRRALQAEIRPPEEAAPEDADVIFVGWGSSRQALLEAVGLLDREGVKAGMIHFTELWPLPVYRFPEAGKFWSVESNGTAQLSGLLKSEYGITFQGHIGRQDGLPLTAEYIRSAYHAQT
jgi:2-oxoglutarate ferredoxin oxidoreductase subunit alpha